MYDINNEKLNIIHQKKKRTNKHPLLFLNLTRNFRNNSSKEGCSKKIKYVQILL